MASSLNSSLSALAPITTGLTALSNLLLVSPQKTVGYQPQYVPGSLAQVPPTIVFHYEGEQTATLESDITDHYIENNTAIQDQIALRPEMISTHGFIGEVNDIFPLSLPNNINIVSKLTILSAYTPGLTTTALIAYNEAFQLYQIAANAANAAISAVSSLNQSNGENVIGSSGLGAGVSNNGKISGNQNKQQTYFQLFYGYWRSRTLFTVQTPWAVFQNMAIKSLRAIQDAETNVITDFEVTFKMIRTAQSAISTSAVTQARLTNQSATATNLGTSSATAAPTLSLTSGLSSMGVA